MSLKHRNFGDPLDCLAEECSEVIHMAMKIKRFGLLDWHPNDEEKTPNIVRLRREFEEATYQFERFMRSASEHNDKCIYPDWEGGYLVERHKLDKDGYCIFCGKHYPSKPSEGDAASRVRPAHGDTSAESAKE